MNSSGGDTSTGVTLHCSKQTQRASFLNREPDVHRGSLKSTIMALRFRLVGQGTEGFVFMQESSTVHYGIVTVAMFDGTLSMPEASTLSMM